MEITNVTFIYFFRATNRQTLSYWGTEGSNEVKIIIILYRMENILIASLSLRY